MGISGQPPVVNSGYVVCGLGSHLTLTWSIQIMSAPAMEMASPPQTYWGLISVKCTFWMMMFLTPLAMYTPLPLMTPAEPWPTRDLLDWTLIAFQAALSYVMELTVGELAW